MPKPVPIVESIAVSLDKSDIDEYIALHGKTNSKPLLGFAEGQLKFLKFEGALKQSSGKYEGEYRFTAGDVDGERADLNQLPGLQTESDLDG